MELTDESKGIIRTLNDLIEISKDGEKGFKACADDVERPDLRQLFIEHSRQCGSAAAELQRAVLELGGVPEQTTSLGADLHRGWVGLKSLMSGKDEATILDEVERGEDLAEKHYAEALHHPLPTDVRAIVQRQYEGVRHNHDQIKALRNVARG